MFRFPNKPSLKPPVQQYSDNPWHTNTTAMRTRTGNLVAVLWIIFTASCVDGSSYDIIADDDSQGRLLLILIDGVRWDQVLDPDLHGFNEIIRTGVWVDHMQPVFPANSYVNYYAIATGKVEPILSSIFVTVCIGIFQIITSSADRNLSPNDIISYSVT